MYLCTRECSCVWKRVFVWLPRKEYTPVCICVHAITTTMTSFPLFCSAQSLHRLGGREDMADNSAETLCQPFWQDFFFFFSTPIGVLMMRFFVYLWHPTGVSLSVVTSTCRNCLQCADEMYILVAPHWRATVGDYATRGQDTPQIVFTLYLCFNLTAEMTTAADKYL